MEVRSSKDTGKITPSHATTDDARRHEALRQYAILDTQPEQALDDLTALAAHLCGTPIALISLADGHRQWFKATFGLEMAETPRDISFCDHAVKQQDLFIVPDATQDKRFAQNPLVTGEPRVRFYAGAPLVSREETTIGMLSVIDRVPRELTQSQQQALRVLARQVMTHLDLRRQTRELMESEGRFRQLAAIVEFSDDAIIGKNLNSIVTSWNRGAERIFGYAAAEIVGTSVMQLIPGDRQGEENHILGRIESGEGVEHFETRRLTKSGRIIDVSVTASPIKDATGMPIGVSKVARDITDRKQAEVARSATEARYRTLFEYAPDGILIADPLSYYIDANSSICRMLGYTREELIGMHASDIVVQSEIGEIGPALRDIKSKSDYHREWQFRRKGGSTFSAEVIATMMPDGNLLGMIRDITERKSAQEQIGEQAALLEKARDAILVRSLDGKILFWNKGAERMYGWVRQEAIGRNIGEFLYLNPKQFEELNRVAISQGEWSGEIQHITREKRKINVEARWTLIRDDDGQPKSVLAINTDVTEKKNIEAQLMRAQRMENIGTLASGIAHDLNNILAPITLSIEALKSMSDQPKAMKMLEAIEVSAKRGADIVRQVLSFARGMEGERVEVQPNHMLKDLERIIKDTFPKDIRLQFAILHETWTILGDPTQIHQILLNLCVNARDAMPDGGSLTVSIENCILDEQYVAMNIEAKAGRFVKISVTDSGTGIPHEVIDKIFIPFFTTKELNKGTGLGLSTVVAIVKSHNGFINVYSEPGAGTTFKVYLPAMEISSAAREQVFATVTLPRGNGETILVVDDENSILTITSQTLLAFGYQVLTATDGADALAVYVQHQNNIAVVLTDMMMPVMDGAAMIYALLRINPAAKIIGASGLNAYEGVVKASGTGIKHFLTKPYTAETLLKTIRAILDEPEWMQGSTHALLERERLS